MFHVQDLSGGGTNYYKGRLSSVTAGATTVSYNTYDADGRVTKHTQRTDNKDYVFFYGYNLAGANISMTYPAGRVVTTSYDAAGRPERVNAGTTIYMQGVTYAPHGAVAESQYGGLFEKRSYNARLQPVGLTLGSSSGSTSALGLTMAYGGADNNGNVLSQEIFGRRNRLRHPRSLRLSWVFVTRKGRERVFHAAGNGSAEGTGDEEFAAPMGLRSIFGVPSGVFL